jgi:hypothetical protein
MVDGRSDDDGGLIDLSELSFDDLSTAQEEIVLSRALDRILAVSDNSAGFHGFNNFI